MTQPLVRPRREDDLPGLARLLEEQQPVSAYPLRWPLPFPTERFLVRPTEERAWVAEVDGALAGHVAVISVDPAEPTWREAGPPDAVAVVAVLFVARDRVGSGLGTLLHDVAVAWIRETGRRPVLDVVPTHSGAVEFYQRRGWQLVGEARPPWLPPERPALLLMTLP